MTIFWAVYSNLSQRQSQSNNRDKVKLNRPQSKHTAFSTEISSYFRVDDIYPRSYRLLLRILVSPLHFAG